MLLPKKSSEVQKEGHCGGCGADFEDENEHTCGGSEDSQDEGSQDEGQ